ncbi:MAG: lipoate--protein ligase family protein [Candidatus Edwardsbacteria bacterium]|nr:lipoate--protein ligase family protein [Candidatus Edwardsbacteria bacterium]MBU1577286.1 lipoate--protein ligase family protein [Candidatus Edwardsbacteria bacterium]MBU2462835.1 lipoate--protein ligase family protein [Candidatus Edwardsbacteria bacterium]MBU2594887.1 lipoate--protein ligase family protein [Candidatus Edwardsbacteria bacterium]
MSTEKTSWRFLNTGLGDGAYNMALDQALVESVGSGASLPVIRFFGWNPPAVSLGYNQKIKDLDIEACRKAGFDIVRRPTGGRAVIHQDEFTYSVIARENDPVIGGTIMETYGRIAQGLLAGLKILGVAAEMVRSSAPDIPATASALCFAAAGRYEITAGGKKLIGSAQRRMNGVILQQGSLLMTCGQEHKFFSRDPMENRAGTLREILGREPAFDEVAAGMEQGFMKSWNIELAPDSLTQDEENTAGRLKPGLIFVEG